MKERKLMKGNIINGILATLGSVIAGLFGGWTSGLTVLCIFMVIDFISGIAAALVNKSSKTNTGGLSSKVIWTGIIKKIFTLAMVVVGAQLDILSGANYIRDAVVIAYVITETISIVENAGLIGLPIPSILQKVIDVLKEKNEGIEVK